MEILTGNFNHRIEKKIFSDFKLVLSVEVRGSWQSNKDLNDPKNGHDYTAWRDATAQDLAELYRMGVFK